MKKLLITTIMSLLLCLILVLSVSATSGTGSTSDNEFLTFIIAGIIAFIVVGGIFALVVVSKYKKKKRGTSYPFKEFTDLELTNQYDLFITKTVTRVRVRSSSSSSKK
jgi:heme/copper-type cytochrome/quinol oxidase subunit 2